MPQRVRREIEREAIRPELVGGQVTGVSGVRTDLEKRRELPDERCVPAQDRAPLDVHTGVFGDGPLVFAERGKVVKLDLRALNSERLRIGGSSQHSCANL